MLELSLRLQRDHFFFEADVKLEAPMVGIFGASGSGKTTFLHLIAGVVSPSAGSILLDGEVLFDSERRINLPPHRRKIALVFQDARLFPHYSVEGNLRYGEKLLRPSERRFQFEQIVELLSLGELLAHPTHRLSGGEKQRVALGRALLSSPRLLLCDEPLAALDHQLKRQILPFFRRIQEELNIPILYVSHDLGEILQLTDELVLIERGEILAHGHFLNLIEKTTLLPWLHDSGLMNIFPMYAQKKDEISGCCRFVSSLLKKNSLVFYGPPPSLKSGAKVLLSIRPEDIALAKGKQEEISIQNQCEAIVANISEFKGRFLVKLDLVMEGEQKIALLSKITPQAMNHLKLQIGSKIWCLVKSHAIEVIPH